MAMLISHEVCEQGRKNLEKLGGTPKGEVEK